MLRVIKKTGIKRLEDVYALLGTSKQNISYWRNNPASTTTKRAIKHKTVTLAAELFGLNHEEAESLANKAGLSLSSNENSFTEEFGALVLAFPGKIKELCDSALVSTRMHEHMKQGKHLRKETTLAILITLGLDLPEIQRVLIKAGFILSASLPGDMIVMHKLKNELAAANPQKRVRLLNEILFDFGLPLLMTR